ncbi:hypothetical protein AAG565_02695 [Fontimonas sp. SYSU GA230001]|uniref:hypothetical protein n=1 Tax=Fontimonas sp. SYSU GA230001 TaxID=3142450 RepID=UPI0032B38497
MHAPDWLLTLQWTALFAVRMFAGAGPAAPLTIGAALAAGWFVTAGPARHRGANAIRAMILLLAATITAVLVTALSACPLTGDRILAAQLRHGIADTALLLLAGAGLSAAAGLAGSLRATHARRGHGA